MAAENTGASTVREQGSVTLQCPKLTESNYTSWSILVETVLRAHGLWKTVTGEDEDEKRNYTTKAIIYPTLPEDILLQVAKYKDAQDVWESIQIRYFGTERQYSDLESMPLEEAVGQLKAYEDRLKNHDEKEEQGGLIWWNEEDTHLVNIDTKARSLISMSLPDDVFHSICYLRTAKEVWDTLCVQYEANVVLIQSRKIYLVRQYEKFMHSKGETLSQTYQRFNCLLIDLKTIGIKFSSSEVVTKFMEFLPEY
ncbi:hypothetical protein OSB04_016540 [Centaurea solstitialis]|uniref:DUF4219 domain-containing protein n=1 Tax=Centaurea solstitialis TaxID=347529 RepID=A0AA38T155_9ASTR|nr:hypothetical protein OSB04_016540 [Centaurea solstitialis]